MNIEQPNILTIQGNRYELIEDTQSDGRCFSASIFYDLNLRPAEDKELNDWIQVNIINPILATELENCPQFLHWAYMWIAQHNGNLGNPGFFTLFPEEILLSPRMSNLKKLFDRIEQMIRELYIYHPKVGDVAQMVVELLRIIGELTEDEETIEFIPNIQDLFQELTTELFDLNKKLLRLDNSQDKPIEINIDEANLIGELDRIDKTVCEQFKEEEDYKMFINSYKEYVKSLNKPVNRDGIRMYEWTEPDAGPVDVILKSDGLSMIGINSINIFVFRNDKLLRRRNYPNIYSLTAEKGAVLDLYYDDGYHYKPLILMAGSPKRKEEVKMMPVEPNISSTIPLPISSKSKDTSSKSKDKSSKSKDKSSRSKKVTATGKPIEQPSVPPIVQNAPPSAPPIVQNAPPSAPPIVQNAPPSAPPAQPVVVTAQPVSQTSQPVVVTAQPVSQTSQKETKSDTKDSDTNKKDEKIPNSLIIYIKTRIPNFYKVNYEPYMSVPKNKSHTVYFDPLIKYYEGPIKNIPSGAPKDAVITQFFEAAEFDSMINRILSDFRYMQKPRTFKQAYDEHIIENNLRITLKNLFKTNNLFYINKKPYTIVGVKSNTSDWQIDKKPLEKLLGQFTHLTPKQIEEEAKKEEDDIPEVLRQGNVASSTIADSETASVVAEGLKKATEEQNTTSLQQEISGITDSFVHQDELPGVAGDILDLYTKYLRQNTPINYLNTTDLARDPLTLSLLVDSADLLKFINTHKKSSLVNLYAAFTNAKISLQQADKSYLDLCKEYAKYKTKFDDEIKTIRRFISNKLSKLPISEQKQETNKLMQQITQLKVGYMEILFKIADSINQIYQQQNVYFITTKALLQGLKEDYGNIIKYYEKPQLALKCIDDDIDTISSLIEKDPENPYSVSYFTNYNNFKEFYEKQLYKNRQELLEPQINFAEEAEIYINEPEVLLIEKEQYEIYNFKLLLSYSYNQFDIWVVLFKSIETFILPISKIVSDIIEVADDSRIELNQNYTIDEQNTYLKTIGMEGIRADFDKQTKTLTWYLVKDDGTNAIKSVKRPDGLLLDNLRNQHRKTGKSLKDIYRDNEISDKELFQDLYIEYVKTSVKAYDAIILYIYLLEILCLRQNRVYVAEENVNQLNLEYSLTLENYFDRIVKNTNNIRKLGGTASAHIPPSLLWDTSNLGDMDVVKSKQKINTKSNIIYRARLKSIDQSRNNLVESCDEISKIITPNISKTGFIKQCSNIVTNRFDVDFRPPHIFRSSYWIEQTIKNYDIHSTKDFIYNMSRIVKDAWHDRIIQDIDVNDYLDWTVFDNDIQPGNTDSLYAAIADGLNRQLEMTDNETTNDYTETIDGRKMFTTKTLKELFIDSKTPEQPDNAITTIKILERVLKIKFIIFEMYPRDSQIYIGDMVLYKGRPNRVMSISITPDGKNTYNLYNGYTEIKNVPERKVYVYPNNPLKNFRIFCNDNGNQDIEFNDYMYIVLTKEEDEDTGRQDLFKFKLLHNTRITYIFTEDLIPIYIKYLIFNSCPNLDRDKLFRMGFGNKQLRDDILEFKDMREQRIENENLRDKMDDINKKIKKYKDKITKLDKIVDKSYVEKAEYSINTDMLRDLKQQKTILKDILKQSGTYKVDAPLANSSVLGGATTLKPSEQYYSNINQYNPTGYPLNPNVPSNVVYLPRQGYPYQGSYYSRQYRVPYNVAQNKAKDQKSKLSFYITIELELFPGTSANMFQKSVVKCQSTFERIREAWADIFGFEYRPAPMTEAYSYIAEPIKKNDNKNKTEKNKSELKRTTDKNKTRKNKPSK